MSLDSTPCVGGAGTWPEIREFLPLSALGRLSRIRKHGPPMTSPRNHQAERI